MESLSSDLSWIFFFCVYSLEWGINPWHTQPIYLLLGKVVHEDNKRNPARIAENVGDNVGDTAGMGADFFGSFAEATCTALVLAASSHSVDHVLDGTHVSSAHLFPWNHCRHRDAHSVKFPPSSPGLWCGGESAERNSHH